MMLAECERAEARVTMKTDPARLEAAFIDQQRRRLAELRDSIVTATQVLEKYEADVRSSTNEEVHEPEDDAQKLDALELGGNLVVRDVQRLEQIDRALRKIADGTYGVSDVSGKPIPKDRLEAVPEATTLAGE
jgi:DnaK suppressor protein